jgi:hypothetical protein
MQELATAQPAESRRNLRWYFAAGLRQCAYGASHILERKPACRIILRLFGYVIELLRMELYLIKRNNIIHSLAQKPEKPKSNRLTMVELSDTLITIGCDRY